MCSFPGRLAKGDWVGAAGLLCDSGREGVWSAETADSRA